ncbi:MAG: Fic family protein, partial [Bacteroidota bacterium]|nr:Fic family protein [Bacteroidota bacterium]
QGNSTPFIVFMLGVLDVALEELLASQNISVTPEKRIQIFKEHIREESFTRQAYLNYFKELSTATASRDLKQASANKILIKKGEKNLTEYRFREGRS